MSQHETTTKAGRPGGPPPGKPYISAASGRHAGRLYPIEPGTPRLLGRAAECNPRFPNEARVSRIHAEVSVDAAGVVSLRDMSLNGTAVGDQLVQRERIELKHGDWIILGAELDELRAEWLSDAELQGRILPFVDELTDLWTRRHLASRFADVLDSEEDMSGPLSVIMLDVDHFGRFNKSHGQKIGDEVLRNVASTLRSTIRDRHPGADASRHGGEEFIVLLPRCTQAEAVSIAEACRLGIEALELTRSGKRLQVTGSFGVGTCQPEPGLVLEDLIHRANEQLIRAKHSGRNRTCWEGDGLSAGVGEASAP